MEPRAKADAILKGLRRQIADDMADVKPTTTEMEKIATKQLAITAAYLTHPQKDYREHAKASIREWVKLGSE